MKDLAKEVRWWKRGTIVFATLFLILLISIILPEEQPTPKQILATPSDVTIDDDPIVGDEDAPVTIIAFSDFQCPYCKQMYEDVFPILQEHYLNTGKVRLVHRDLPLVEAGHAWSQKAAEAGECADDQGKFWEMATLLFANQQLLNTLQVQVNEPSKNTVTLTLNDQQVFIDLTDAITLIKKLATQTGIDVNQFNACLDGAKQQGEVLKDKNDALKANIQATPTFIINGKRVEGAVPFDTLRAVIEGELYI
jgi:protein-disulfide isomerase